MPIVYKDSESKNKLDLEDNPNSIKNIESLEKENSDLSALDEKGINNKKTKTPLKQQSSPMNFQLKRIGNFQMKPRKNTFTESDYYNSSKYNSMNIKSPIYSYFDQSQKYLSANYNGENYFNYSENKNEKKNLEQDDNPKKTKNEENSENIPGSIQIKTDKSIEHESESMNYNDYNFFMSPDNHNSSMVSSGINNNLPTNKISRKSSQATPSYKRVNSQNNFVYQGATGENDNIDFNIDIPMNESNDEYSNNFINMNNNINNDENKINNELVNNSQLNNNDNNNFVLGNLGNPWLNINNNDSENINTNEYINKMNQLNVLNNINNLGNINNNISMISRIIIFNVFTMENG